ncbi:MAG: hypothetical protein LBL23_06840 [Coriobacteriales bacterium]|nr:hypothetical protein [Coriobacteriales bacterium]
MHPFLGGSLPDLQLRASLINLRIEAFCISSLDGRHLFGKGIEPGAQIGESAGKGIAGRSYPLTQYLRVKCR